jgi:hypothetical protein
MIVAHWPALRYFDLKNEGPNRSRETLAFGQHPRFGQPASGWLRYPLAAVGID